MRLTDEWPLGVVDEAGCNFDAGLFFSIGELQFIVSSFTTLNVL